MILGTRTHIGHLGVLMSQVAISKRWGYFIGEDGSAQIPMTPRPVT